MKWKIITDSSCDLKINDIEKCGQEIRFESVPFIISVGKDDFVDDGNVAIDEMLAKMEENKEIAHTSCPAPASWTENIQADENVIMVTISKELSGSYNSACVAKDMMLEDEPDRNVAVVNSFSAGPGLAHILENICDEITNGKSFDEVVKVAEDIAAKQKTLFALCSFDNLVKNGRMSKLVGFIAGKLNFWGIGEATDEGKIAVKDKVRGAKKALQKLLSMMVEDVHNLCTVHISHCKNFEMATQIKEMLEDACHGIRVEINETKGLCSFYAEKQGLMISFV